MSGNQSRYEALLNDISEWLKQSAKQDVNTMMDIVKHANAYLHALEDLSTEEIQTLENYLLRDLKGFSQQVLEDVDNSLWWKNTKQNIWNIIGLMSDHNKVEFFEMLEDLDHKGIYQTGEFIAMGDLICTQCSHLHPITGVQRIIPCVECGCDSFSRINVKS
jgi:hypothetical protein